MDIKTINLIGLISVGVYLLFGLTSLILSGVSFETMNTNWAQGSTKHLAPVNLAVTISLIVCSIFGFLVFTICSTTKCFLYIYLVIIFLSLLFSWGIGIFASIGGTIYHKKNYSLGCDSELTGVLEMWKNVDDYLIYTDSLLCSPICPCKFTKEVDGKYLEHYLLKKIYDGWTKEVQVADQTNHILFNFGNCSDTIQKEALKRYKETQIAISHSIKPEEFVNYWSSLERRFNCSGWCKTSYINPYTYERASMVKFVFSDINAGIPKYPGCLNQIINWLPSLMGAIGGCLIVSSFLQTISWILALSLLGRVPEKVIKVNPESN